MDSERLIAEIQNSWLAEPDQEEHSVERDDSLAMPFEPEVKSIPFKGLNNQPIELFMARIDNNTTAMSKNKLKGDNGTVSAKGDARESMALVQDRYRSLYREFEIERATRLEAEKAFQNLMTLYEEMRKKWGVAATSSRQAFDIADQMRQKYCEQKTLTEDNLCQLENANETIKILKQFLTQEKRRTDKLKAELKIFKNPPAVDHSACDQVLELERKDKENALEKIKELCEQLEDMRKERDMLKKSNREMKEKTVSIINIKNELVQQNRTLMTQRDTLRSLVDDKDGQIERLREHLDKDILQEPIVLDKIAKIEECERKKREALKDEIESLNNNIEELNTKIAELEDMVASRNLELKNMCRDYAALKREYSTLVEKLEADILNEQEKNISLVEATKTLKTERNELKDANENLEKEISEKTEEIRGKDAEISVLVETKTLLEDKIKLYKYETESMRQLAEEFEGQIESTRNTMKELENYKYAIKRQLREAEEELHQQKENNYIQEKMLEDSRDTVKILKCRLKECCQQLNKCVREKEVLLCERDCVC